MNLLLINISLFNKGFIVSCLLPNTEHIFFNPLKETYESIIQKIPSGTYTRVGIIQDNPKVETYSLFNSFGEAIIKDVETQDSVLSTWQPFIQLFNYFKTLGATNIDFIECTLGTTDALYIKNYLSANYSIEISFSDNIIGTDGDWILESDNVILIGLYFNEYIQYYPYSLGSSSSGQVELNNYTGHISVINNVGEVWSWGKNWWGCFGVGNNLFNQQTWYFGNFYMKMNLPAGSQAISVGGGYGTTLVVLSNGTVWGCGVNISGQTGTSNGYNNWAYFTSTSNAAIPIQIPGITNAVDVASGESHSLILLNTGDVLACGWNGYGQLGINSTANDGYSYLNTGNLNVTVPVILIEKVKQISASLDYSVFLGFSGAVYACGIGWAGQLGVGDTELRIVPTKINTNTLFKTISAGVTHVLAIDVNGNIWGWGGIGRAGYTNIYGLNNTSPVQITTGTVYREISSGYSHCAAMDTSNRLWTWGDNFNGALGYGDLSVASRNTTINIPTLVNTSLLPLTPYKLITSGYHYTHVGYLSGTNIYKMCSGLNTASRLRDPTDEVSIRNRFIDSSNEFPLLPNQTITFVSSVPTITSTSPGAYGNPNNTITISGTNLSNVTTVSFGGVSSTFSYNSGPNTISATIPSGSGTVNLILFNSSGPSTSLSFTYSPTVSTVTSSGYTGSSITITGTAFNTSTVTNVLFGVSRTPATSFNIVNSTQITAVVPSLTQGSQFVFVTGSAGDSGSALITITAVPSPTFTGISTTGYTGGTITLSGTFFTPSTITNVFFTFSRIPATSFTIVNSTQITAVVPSISEGTQYVFLRGTSADITPSQAITIVPAPTIPVISLSNSFGYQGNIVIINGTSLDTVSEVKFGSTVATFTYNSGLNNITATVPSGTGVNDVSVKNPAGTSSSSSFTIITSPTISSVTPNNGVYNSTVIITGTNFAIGSTSVKFGTTSSSITVNSLTQITATVPNLFGRNDVTVTNSVGTSTSSLFTVNANAPTITNLNPSTGIQGSSVTITGTNLHIVTEVRFNSTLASFTLVSSTELRVTVPNVTGSNTVTVTNPASTSGGLTFTINSPPVITSFNTSFGYVNNSITINGLRLSSVTNVSFGTVRASFTPVSDNQITVTIPSITGNNAIVTLKNSGGDSNTQTFYYYPTITSFNTSLANSNETLTVYGSQLTSANGLLFNNTSVIVSSNTDIQLSAIIPNINGSNVSVRASNIYGKSNYQTLSYYPFVSSINSSIGYGGDTVMINGSHFSNATSVLFNSTAVSFTPISDTQVSAIVSNQGGSSAKVKVERGNASSNTQTFSYYPVTTSLNSSLGYANDTIIITGTNFSNATSVLFNSTAVPFTYISDTQVSAIVSNQGGSSAAVKVARGNASSNTQTFSYYPVISAFNTSIGNVANTITITGTNMLNITNVLFGTTNATFTAISDTQVSAIVPNISSNLTNVKVARGNASSNQFAFYYYPIISEINSSYGNMSDTITITGTHLSNTTGVLFGTTNATFINVSDSQVNASVPNLAVGSVNVKVVNPNTSSNLKLFTYYPIITSLNKYSGNSGESLTIYGKHLTEITTVVFNTTNLTPTVVSDSQVTTTIPDLPGSVLNVQLKNTSVSSNIDTFTYFPVINSFNSSFGTEDTLLTIYGKHLTNINNIVFNDTVVSANGISDTEANALIPFLQESNISIRAKNTEGFSNTKTFTYYPEITSIDKLYGSPGDTLTITGNHLATTTNVLFNDTNVNTLSVTSTEVKAIVPDLSTINLSVKIVTSNTSSNIEVFTYLPVISSTNLSAIVNTNITISGKKFIPSSYVLFGNTNVTPVRITESEIEVTVPPGSINANLKVINPYGDSNTTTFKYLPSITSFSPIFGTTNTPLTITGTNLINTSFVTFGNASTKNITNLTDSSLLVYVPENSGNVSIYVTDILNVSIVAPERFTYLNSNIAYINPLSGTEGTIISVIGQNLLNTSSFSFGNVTTEIVNLTNNSFNVYTPEGTGNVSLRFTNNLGTSFYISDFTYLNPSIFTNTSFGTENMSVILTGENLRNTSFVLFGTTPTTFTNTTNQIIATIPYSLNNNETISVINNMNSTIICPDTFMYLPVLTSLNISTGVPNNIISINGSHLFNTSSLFFGPNSASFIIESNNLITATVPPGEEGSIVNVVAKNLGNSNGLPFTYYNTPTITTINPTSGIERVNMIISGRYFSNTSTVLFNEQNVSFRIVSDTVINASVPPGRNGNVSVQITGSNGSSNYKQFTYNYLRPTISSVYNNTKKKSTSGIPGDTLFINGSNLTGTTIYFNDNPTDSTYISNSSTQLMFPYGILTGNVSINASGPGGKSDTIRYICDQQSAVITSFSKTNGIPGDEIMITGNYLYGTKNIMVGTKNASFTPISETNVSFRLPFFPPGPYKLFLSNSKETIRTILNTFTYNFQPPVITSLINTSGIAGQTLLINGTNFYSLNNVFFANTVFSSTKIPLYKYINETQVSIVIPPGLPGNVNVSLNTPAGFSNIVSFKYNYRAPIITSVNLNGIPGRALIINGTNFTNVSVLFGTINASINTISDTQINVSIPDLFPGISPLYVSGPNVSVKTNFLTNFQGPIINSVESSNGVPGDSVSIIGKNLFGLTEVKFFNSLTNIRYVNDTLVNVSVPQNLPGTYNITIKGPAGTATKPFTYNYQKPIITTFTPPNDVPGKVLTINGAKFTNASVLFGTTRATITSITDTKIMVTIPEGIPGLVNVNVCGPNSSTQLPFTYNYRLPIITSLSTRTGIPGNTIQINGKNFTDTRVLFGNTPTTFSVVSDTLINTSVPVGLPGLVNINVSGPSGYVLTPFTYNFQVPNIQLNNSTGVQGDTIIITGTNLFGTTSVQFGNTVAVKQNMSDTQVNVSVPAGLPGQVNIVLRTPAGPSQPVPFTYNYRRPEITNFNTLNGIPGAPLTINGRNFSNLYNLKNVSVYVDNDLATVTRFTDTTISIILPDNLPGNNAVIVETPGGTSLPLNFNYNYQKPTISINPNRGILGDTISVTGTNLLGTSRVTFGKTNTSFVILNNNSLNASVPAGLPGAVTVTTTGPAGTSPTVPFTYNFQQPSITSLNNTSGIPKNILLINGTNLFGTNSVIFGSNNATLSKVSDTQVTVTVPPNLPGLINVSLTSPGGTTNTNFTYNYQKPIISTLNKKAGIPGETLIITGKNLFNTTTVLFSGNSATINSNTDTQLNVTIPEAIPGSYNVTVVSPGGTSNGAVFFYGYQAPILSSLNTSMGNPIISGIPGDTLLIQGTNLLDSRGVLFSNNPAIFTNINNTNVSSIVSYCLPGENNLLVKGKVGDSNVLKFICNYEKPEINRLSITRGKLGDRLIITGKHLIDGQVSFNFYEDGSKIYIKPLLNTDFSITVTVPKGVSALTTDVSVKTKGGISNNLEFTYNYLQPIINTIQPVNNSLTITGENFIGITRIECISSRPKIIMNFTLDQDNPNTLMFVSINSLKGNLKLNIINTNAFPTLQTTTNVIVP